MSTRVDGFPAGKHGGRGCARILAKDRADSRHSPPKKETEEGRTLYLRVSSSHNAEKKNTPTRGEINFSNSGVWHGESKKISPSTGRVAEMEIAIQGYSLKEEINFSFPMRFSDVTAFAGFTLTKY